MSFRGEQYVMVWQRLVFLTAEDRANIDNMTVARDECLSRSEQATTLLLLLRAALPPPPLASLPTCLLFRPSSPPSLYSSPPSSPASFPLLSLLPPYLPPPLLLLFPILPPLLPAPHIFALILASPPPSPVAQWHLICKEAGADQAAAEAELSRQKASLRAEQLQHRRVLTERRNLVFSLSQFSEERKRRVEVRERRGEREERREGRDEGRELEREGWRVG